MHGPQGDKNSAPKDQSRKPSIRLRNTYIYLLTTAVLPITAQRRAVPLQMLKRLSAAPPTPRSERRRQPSKQARLQSWWLRLFIVLFSVIVAWQIVVLLTGHQLSPWYLTQPGHQTVHWSWLRPSCPLEYKRQKWADIQAGNKRPYLFGGQQEPKCSNCDVDALWSHFCQFKSHVRSCCQPQQLSNQNT